MTRAARQVTSPTLVLHARDDALVPFSEGRLLATLIPGARFVAESRNHILLADEPAWADFRGELDAFLGPVPEPPAQEELSELTHRELEVLARVADGLDNKEIAARLHQSVRTVERHLSNIYAKLRVSGKAARAAAAARFARARGLPPVRD